MAFDGITISNIVKECKDELVGGRIYKIAQPEQDELLLTIKVNGGQKRLFLSADASLPLLYLTEYNKTSPLTAPNFCMLLRKHIQNARIVDITQPGLERIVIMELEHLNELGDLCKKYLITEIMGKHSNIIFCNEESKIIDSMKHISGMISSVREVLPGRDYFIPKTQEKKEPTSLEPALFAEALAEKAMPVYKAIYTSFTGISPLIAQEICYRANVDATRPATALEAVEKDLLVQSFYGIIKQVKQGEYAPNIVYENGVPKEYASIVLTSYPNNEKETNDANERTQSFTSISTLLETYYKEKNEIMKIRQKSVDLRKIVQTALERISKKYDLQLQQMKDTEKKEQYRIYGELLNAYGYGIEPGMKSMEALNYYDNTMVTIPLDPMLTAGENAKKYFDKYGKLKRTQVALSALTKETKEELEHLESISNALDIAVQEADLVQIKEELIQSGYIKRKGGTKKEKVTSKPFHYLSSDGFHIYVGKNNFQNEEITFRLATGNDWWFHAKGIPGSHVIVKTNGKELPDRTFEEAGRLAAHYSKGKGQEKIEVDYIEKKHVKKPSGGKPGFVVYYTNYSLLIDSDISRIECVKE